MLKNNLRWKPIEGYENLYLISEEGDVWSIKRGKMLKTQDNGKGYLFVGLHKDGKVKYCYIHRLVADAFIDNPYDNKEVNHIDGNKHNNRVDNLEWVTRLENARHAQDNGLYGKAIRCVETNAIYSSMTEVKRQTGIWHTAISEVCHGRRKTAGGYHWEFVN